MSTLLLLQRRNLSLKRRFLDEETIVRMASTEDAGRSWEFGWSGFAKDGVRILGRVVASQGSKGAVRVRWRRACPPQALGYQVKILL